MLRMTNAMKNYDRFAVYQVHSACGSEKLVSISRSCQHQRYVLVPKLTKLNNHVKMVSQYLGRTERREWIQIGEHSDYGLTPVITDAIQACTFKSTTTVTDSQFSVTIKWLQNLSHAIKLSPFRFFTSRHISDS
jgi:predicted nucleic acid-binding Zn finger protein